MGACQSSQDGEEEEKKKRSRMIDAKLEEDSRRLRKECKILLLGTFYRGLKLGNVLIGRRLWREWEVYHCQANEDYTPKRIHQGRIGIVPPNNIQERP